jgi:uncharacterized membrane-anchored protein
MKISLKIILPVFIIVSLAQWLVPAKMIFNSKEVLKKGKAYRFLTEPVDPTDPFKGKYITLNFKAEEFILKSTNITYGQTIFVLLGTDSAGFAYVTGISEKEPSNGADYVKATTQYVSKINDSAVVHINYPFDRFYMDEYKAPKAEDIYQKANRDTSKITYALVKIWKGAAVIENVIIGNKPIQEWMH